MTQPNQPLTIAIDAMGGDHAPEEIVKGALQGVKEHGVKVQLCGPEALVQAELDKYPGYDRSMVEVVHCEEVIEMHESPATAIRRKKKASIVVTAKQVKQGLADAMVAAGSTGAAMAASLLYIGRIEGIDRPAIAVFLPSLGKPTLLLDAGANADCIPEMLLQFAHMGSVFMESVYGIAEPTIGILNIGEELGKGNSLANASFNLISKESTLNFKGNMEGNDLFKGTFDVAVCDGFVGNVALKSAEGVSKMLLGSIKGELGRNIKAKAGALLAKSALQKAKAKVDPHEYGGALLLGINGICVIGHGSSDAYAIQNAIRVAKQGVEAHVLSKIGGAVLAEQLSPESASDSFSSDTSSKTQKTVNTESSVS
jgi:glycerol-3-phosphate acyltransferase PlsX